MTETNSARSVVTYAAVLARAAAYSIRAQRTRAAVERLESRYRDRADSARYLSEAMTKLNVDEETTTAYMEVATLSNAMASNVREIASASDTLAASAMDLESQTRAQHGRMADANHTHSVQMADREFIERQ